jgi:hypothetical protein
MSASGWYQRTVTVASTGATTNDNDTGPGQLVAVTINGKVVVGPLLGRVIEHTEVIAHGC